MPVVTTQKNSTPEKYPNFLTTEDAVHYLRNVYGIKTTPGTMAVQRCQGRGFRYTRINSRPYYRRQDIDLQLASLAYIETIESPGGLESR